MAANADEPDVVLMDDKHQPPVPKAFHTGGDLYAWERRRLALANKFDDWRPVKPWDVVAKIGEMGGES